jgi:hypothetical protein
VKAFVLLVALAACGRLGFDAGETPPVFDIDAQVTPGVCPSATVETKSDSGVCIETAQRGIKTWVGAKDDCASNGRRLCGDAEWLGACEKAPGLQAMVDDWEWVAEETGGIASKRGGAGACTDTSRHEIDIDPFGYRCCVDK